MEVAVQKIPKNLIYEMVEGKPIYYKGFRAYLNGEKQIEEIISSSKLQSLIIAELIFLLRSFFGDDYLIFTNEIGLQFSKKSWRAADIAVVEANKVLDINDKYLEVAPDIVFEIDTKAELNEIKNPLGYYHEKTDKLLKFGVEKVIWIFTDTKKIMIAEKNKQWILTDWKENIEIKKGLSIDLKKMLDKWSV